MDSEFKILYIKYVIAKICVRLLLYFSSYLVFWLSLFNLVGGPSLPRTEHDETINTRIDYRRLCKRLEESHTCLVNVIVVLTMIHLIGSYQCTNRPSVWHVLIYIDVPTNGTARYINKSVCTTHIDSLSDCYVPPILGNMPWYGDPWFYCFSSFVEKEEKINKNQKERKRREEKVESHRGFRFLQNFILMPY